MRSASEFLDAVSVQMWRHNRTGNHPGLSTVSDRGALNGPLKGCSSFVLHSKSLGRDHSDLWDSMPSVFRRFSRLDTDGMAIETPLALQKSTDFG